MNRFNNIRIVTAVLAAGMLAACAEKVDKTVTWPEWASRPIVEEAAIIGADGSKTVTAGSKVVYSAKVHDDYSNLAGYVLTITYDGTAVMSESGNVSGPEAELSLEFTLPFASGLSDQLVPEVTLEVVNEDNGKAVKRLDKEHNITVCRPAVPSELFLLDDKGGTYSLLQEGDGFIYRLKQGSDLSGLGTKFVIAAKVSSGRPDYSGLVWGSSTDGIGMIGTGGDWIATPESGGYALKDVSFDTFSFTLSKTVNYKVTVDKGAMEAMEQSGVNYLVYSNVRLVRDCEVEFVGFGDLASMLQADRFEILGGSTAKFTGHSRSWSFYYDADDNWMILNYVNFNEASQVWVTGQNACFPLGNDSSKNVFKYLASDGKDRFATLAAVMGEDGVYRCLVYLRDEYAIQLYSWVKWSTVIAMTSLTPNYGEITSDGVYINPGPEFIPGVYMLTVALTKSANGDGDGAEARISLTPFVN